MKFISAGEAATNMQPMDQAHFTGRAMIRSLLDASSRPSSTGVSLVRFEAGTRNYWHAHGGGQLLHVVEGEGWVQVRNQQPQRMRPGDTVVADPGEEHWHGAGKTGAMAHLAVVMGETRWLEEPAPPAE